LGERLNHFPPQLSGGEQQRVALARAFVIEPEILFADEPTGNLDRATGRDVEELLFKLVQDQNTALIMVTHDDELAARCQSHYHLNNGVLVKQGGVV
jgi:putative ABC transport system ATP-binding protein